MKYAKLITGFTALAFAFVVCPAQAQKEGETRTTYEDAIDAEEMSSYNPHLGALLGMIDPEGSSDSGIEYGLDAGIRPSSRYSWGAELTHAETSANDTVGALTRSQLFLKGSYHLGGDTPVFNKSYIGLGLGQSLENDVGRWISGPMVGMDFPILRRQTEGMANSMTLGAVAKYLLYEGASPDTFSVNALIKALF